MPGNPSEQRVVLKGKRILLVEDDLLTACLTAAMLKDLGCNVLGPVATVAAGCAYVVKEELLDAALLDIELRGELVFPLVEELNKRGIRFLFASGCATSTIPPKYREHPRIHKPISHLALADGLRQVMS